MSISSYYVIMHSVYKCMTFTNSLKNWLKSDSYVKWLKNFNLSLSKTIISFLISLLAYS